MIRSCDVEKASCEPGCEFTHGVSCTWIRNSTLTVVAYFATCAGWSHFGQFTIAVVNPREPKMSKYSDTLHRFTKKEHDW